MMNSEGGTFFVVNLGCFSYRSFKFPHHREVEFSIELMSGVAPTSKVSYKMITLELVELKSQLTECLKV